MRNKVFSSIHISLLILISQSALGQTDEKIKPLTEKDLTFSSVNNRFTYELKFPEKINLSTFLGVSAVVANTGNAPFRLEGCLNNNKWVISGIYLEPGETKTLQIFILRSRDKGLTVFPGMKGLPGGTVSLSPINPESIEKISFIVATKESASLTISSIKPYGEFIPPEKISDTPGYYPFIDIYGQYKHADWPGKTKSDNEFKKATVGEEENLRILPGPPGRNRYGGWERGPKLNATGHFRTAKFEGKWWLVDPEGYLFWSHGLTCVGFGNGETRISGREKFFENLPGFIDPYGAFYSNKRKDTAFNFTESNLYRKYGPEWKIKATGNVSKRLRSWGINSFGNWSDPEIYLSVSYRIPYTVGVSSSKFPDVYDPLFRESVKKNLNNLDIRIKDDPYCIGFFIDNELKFNGLTRIILLQPVSSKTRLQFFGYLKSKYTSVDKLNSIWKTSYESWKQIDTISILPEGAKEDMQIFDLKIIDLYFKTCMEELKQFAPEKLYLGSRMDFHFFPDDQSEVQIIKIASQYCSVVSFNRYRFTAEDLILPFVIDKPTIIGEFHFGALDRGLPYAGMLTVANQDQRAEAYYHYVKGALKNPQVVGTHWFQYGDLNYTGRFDGANAQIGFVDICDNPYPEIINAARRIGYQMYEIRSGK